MSLLGLWHPAGAEASTLRVCDTVTDAGRVAAAAACDVAIVAPAPGTPRAELDAAVAHAAGRLAPAGIVWVVARRGTRGAAERAVRRAGLVVADRVLMVPPWPQTAHLVPLSPAALRDAGTRHLGLSPRRARLLGALALSPVKRLALARAARGCGIVAVRPGATAPLHWLGALDGAGAAAATVSQGPRADARVAVALRLRRASQRPDLAVKVALDDGGAARLRAERAALGALGEVAAGAGAAIPRPLAPARAALLAAPALAGRPASALLARSPERLDDVLRAVAGWLLDWNRATLAALPAAADMLERRLLAPARRLSAARPATAGHAAAMCALAARLDGSALAGVAVHDDLTMSNVLLGRERLGIVDWEAASAAGPPLADLWYALADGVARARRVPLRRAVQMLVAAEPSLPAALARLPAAHAAVLRIGADEALLGFHACWLGHADDELRRGAPGPFVAVVEALADGSIEQP